VLWMTERSSTSPLCFFGLYGLIPVNLAAYGFACAIRLIRLLYPLKFLVFSLRSPFSLRVNIGIVRGRIAVRDSEVVIFC
jgi:hypothetical protein